MDADVLDAGRLGECAELFAEVPTVGPLRFRASSGWPRREQILACAVRWQRLQRLDDGLWNRHVSLMAGLRADQGRVRRVLEMKWNGLPQFGLNDVNTFQATLHSNGAITFAYARVDAQYGVIGVAEGLDTGPFNEIDMTADLPGTFTAGAIFEEFRPAHIRSRRR